MSNGFNTLQVNSTMFELHIEHIIMFNTLFWQIFINILKFYSWILMIFNRNCNEFDLAHTLFSRVYHLFLSPHDVMFKFSLFYFFQIPTTKANTSSWNSMRLRWILLTFWGFQPLPQPIKLVGLLEPVQFSSVQFSSFHLFPQYSQV